MSLKLREFETQWSHNQILFILFKESEWGREAVTIGTAITLPVAAVGASPPTFAGRAALLLGQRLLGGTRRREHGARCCAHSWPIISH